MIKDSFLSHTDAALLNRNLVLNYVKDHSPTSRTDIWENMSLSRASVTQIIRQLQESDFILETGEGVSNGGRKPQFIMFNNNALFMYIFDWPSRLLCLVNLGGDILEKEQLSFPDKCTPNAFAASIIEGIHRIEHSRVVDHSLLLGLGINLPGLIDSRNKIVIYSTELGWRNVSIEPLLRKEFDKEVFIERFTNMEAFGEYVYGEAKNSNHFVLICFEKAGIGASTVIRGSCQHGTNYMAGELGHIKLPSDVTCTCGQKGCLEAIVSDLLMQNGGVVDSQVLDYISIGTSTAITVIDPSAVLLTGELIRNLNDGQEKELIEKIHSKVENGKSRDLEIYFSKNSETMGIKGMSANIFSECFPVK